MSNYFGKFPSTIYSLSTIDESTQTEAVTDITKRLGITRENINNDTAFIDYSIRDGDTPENIAHRYYGDSEKHWIVLMSNSIIDPQYEWPLDYRTLAKYVNDKYLAQANTSLGQNGFEWANQNVESYFRSETKTSSSNSISVTSYYRIDKDDYDTLNTAAESYDVVIDGNTVNVEVSKFTRTYYEYELKLNEDKRKIKLLDKRYVPSIMQEFKNVFVTK